MKKTAVRWIAGVLALIMAMPLTAFPALAVEEDGVGTDAQLTSVEPLAELITEPADEPEPLAAEGNTLHEGLILYSTFDDENVDGTTTVKDLTGHGHDGTVVGALEFVDGENGLGKAVKFENQAYPGSDDNAGDRYIKFGTGIIPATTDFSISLWFKSINSGASGNSAIITNKDYSKGNSRGIAWGCFSSDIRINFSATGNSRVELKGTNCSGLSNMHTDKKWHHIVVNYDRDGYMSCYVDQKKVGELSIAATTDAVDSGMEFMLGAAATSFKDAINNAMMDELLIYNRVLETAEITALYNKEKPDTTKIEPEPEPEPEPGPGVVLHCGFDASNGANDVEKSPYQGAVTTNGGLTFVDSELGGKAVRIVDSAAVDGSGNDGLAAHNYIDFGVPISAATFGAGKNFTVSYWYRHDADDTRPNSYGAFISNEDYKNAGTPGFAVGFYPGNGKTNFVSTGGGGRKQTDHIDFDKKGWHHFAFTVTSGGNMLVYQDGVQVKSVAVSDGSAHDGLPLVLGADGKHCNQITNIRFDELSVYNYALSAAEIGDLYQAFAEKANEANKDYIEAAKKAEALKILEDIQAVLNSMEPGALFTQEAIDAIKSTVDAALTQVAGLGGDAAMALAEQTKAEYQKFADGPTPLASFHLVSDVHAEGSSQTGANVARYIAGMKDMKTLNPNTTIAFVNAGDNTQSGQASQYEGFYTATKNHNPVDAEETLILLGNHDVRGEQAGNGGKNWNKDPINGTFPYWETAKGLYKTNNAPYMPRSAQETLYHTKELGGYTFIMLNTEIGLKDSMYMSEAQLNWFEEAMKTAYEKDPTKPIFIISHQALNDTHWRSNTLNGFDGITTYDASGNEKDTYRSGSDAKVKEIMAKYPSGIFLSGHIHNGFGVASVIPRDYGVTVDLPAYKGSENGLEAGGTGYEVMIYDGYVAFRARNFATGTWLPQYDIIVPTGAHSHPQLIQKLESAMSDLLWYSEEDAAKLEAAFGAFWSNVGLYFNQGTKTLNGISSSAAPPADLIYTPEQLAELYAAAKTAWNNIGVLDQVTRLPASRDPYDELRLKWRDYLLGGDGTDLDLNDDVIANYIASLNSTAAKYWNALSKSGAPRADSLFPDLNMKQDGTNERSGNISTTFSRLNTLAQAWATKGTDFYQNDYVRDEIISATDYVVDGYYYANGRYHTGNKAPGNWYHWDISSPTALGNIAVVMYDVLGAARVEKYGKAIQWYAPSCQIGGPNSKQSGAMTGGNLLLKANATAQAGVLLRDASMLENVSTQVKKTVSVYNDPDKLFSTGNPGDGFYADGSFIQHQALPYIAGYGADLYNNFSIFSVVLKGSEWEIKFHSGEDPVIYDFVFSGIEPFLYDTHMMDMVTGRAIVRKGYSDRSKMASVISALVPLRGTFPTAEQNTRFDSMMKYYLSLDPERYLSLGSIYPLKIVKELLENDAIRPRSDYAITKTFAMDRTVHITPDFGLGIAMQSTRTFAHEIINEEGKKTWNIANGMVFLYNEDADQFNGGYWCSVDPTRLPGITAERVEFPTTGSGSGAYTPGSLNTNIYDWTGGSSLGNNGVAGMHMRALSRDDKPSQYAVGPRTGADMKKSYFMFGDRILMLGSSITSTTGDHVETTVENRKIKPDGSNTVTVDGAAADLNGTARTLENPSWLHLAGNMAGSEIGYYFPQDITIQALKEQRTGNWADQGTDSGTATDTYATFYVDHGVSPTDAGYAYVLLPGRTAAETAAYAAAPDVEILRQDGSVHAARDNRQNITCANFWEAGAAGGVSVSAPASVTMMLQGDILTVGVSDPTQRDVPITVSLGYTGTLLSKDDTVTVDEDAPFLRFTVDTTESLGGTHTASFRVTRGAKLELVSAVTSVDDITAAPNTPFAQLGLPTSGIFLATDGAEHTLPILWDRGDYVPGVSGEYDLVGRPVLGSEYQNSADIKLEVRVAMSGGLPQQVAEWDTYVQDGGTAGKPMGFGGTSIPVKQDDPGYYRKGLFRISITSIPDEAQKIYFTFQLITPVGAGFLGAELYRVNNSWDQSAVTWNTIPARVGSTPAASFKPGDINADGTLRLDVTAAVKAAKEAGDTVISFELTAVGGRNGGKNQISVRTIESDAAQKPALMWTTAGLVPAAQDKSNLEMLFNLVNDLDPSPFERWDSQSFSQAVIAARQVLDDPNATVNDVNGAEDGLMVLLLRLREKPLPRP